MRAGREPFMQPVTRLRNGIGADDAAGVEAEFGGAYAQALFETASQKSRSA
jgi:hypothetical protein